MHEESGERDRDRVCVCVCPLACALCVWGGGGLVAHVLLNKTNIHITKRRSI